MGSPVPSTQICSSSIPTRRHSAFAPARKCATIAAMFSSRAGWLEASCALRAAVAFLIRSSFPSRAAQRPRVATLHAGLNHVMAPMVTRTRLFRREHKTISRRRCQLVGEHDESPALNSRRTRGFGRGLQTRRTMAFRNESNCATFYRGAQETPDSTLYCVSRIFLALPRVYSKIPQ